MRSSGRNSGGQGGNRSGNDNRGGGSGRGQSGSRGSNYRGAGNQRDERQQRGGRPPRPEERSYGEYGAGRPGGGSSSGPRRGQGGQGGQGRQGGPAGQGGQGRQGGQGGQGRQGGPAGQGGQGGGRGRGPQQRPSRSRELEAKLEDAVRARHDKPRVTVPKTFGEPEGERLQKVLARAGMGSRRACEELIDQGRVEVNGSVVREQGVRVDPETDEIKVDGLTVATQSYLFFALNKPAGVVSTMEDPDGRQCLGDYVTNRETRLFHVGRLDTETEGIILLTNHGELAHRLTHPRYGVTKTYLAAIIGPIPRDLGKRLREGIELEDGFARADNFRVVENTGKNYLVEVSLHEGRKHIVRRMLAEAGFPVERLVRTRFGPIALGDQKSGWLRRLTNPEVGQLMREVGL
ncbi:pseudouridine synthase [Peterkaempfera bronchialis]|uniref:Pseudouridine synthase n=1 Tax=Peterkaempfera bronchialis TaxID=2126346 RepID=A0A345T284_9ACTN|nr:pseudouridine synthase [Peterkaempfera bronchialis]AXI80089.1 rRNA pseudouridine synthase [Peterkaempfera bronchialis]